MDSSERQTRDGDVNCIFNNNNYCIVESETAFEARCEAHFESLCIVKASSDLLLYFVAVFVAGLLVAAIIFWARKRWKRRKNRRKPENGTLIVSDLNLKKTDTRTFVDETDSPGTKIPTYI